MAKAKYTQDDKDELLTIAYLLEKHQDRIAIVINGCINVPIKITHDDESNGVRIDARFINSNELPYKQEPRS